MVSTAIRLLIWSFLDGVNNLTLDLMEIVHQLPRDMTFLSYLARWDAKLGKEQLLGPWEFRCFPSDS